MPGLRKNTAVKSVQWTCVWFRMLMVDPISCRWSLCFKRDCLTGDTAGYIPVEQTIGDNSLSGGCLNIKILSYEDKNFHHKDKTVSWPSYLYNSNSYPGKTAFYIETAPCWVHQCRIVAGCVAWQRQWGIAPLPFSYTITGLCRCVVIPGRLLVVHNTSCVCMFPCYVVDRPVTRFNEPR